MLSAPRTDTSPGAVPADAEPGDPSFSSGARVPGGSGVKPRERGWGFTPMMPGQLAPPMALSWFVPGPGAGRPEQTPSSGGFVSTCQAIWTFGRGQAQGSCGLRPREDPSRPSRQPNLSGSHQHRSSTWDWRAWAPSGFSERWVRGWPPFPARALGSSPWFCVYPGPSQCLYTGAQPTAWPPGSLCCSLWWVRMQPQSRRTKRVQPTPRCPDHGLGSGSALSLIVSPPKETATSQLLIPVTVAFSGSGVFADVMRLRRGQTGVGWPAPQWPRAL